MKNAFLSFLESFASSRSAAVLDRNRDAFFVKGRAKLTSDVSLRRPQTPIYRKRAIRLPESAPRRSGSLSFVSTRRKVKFLLFFRIIGNFTNFSEKSQAQTSARRQSSARQENRRQFRTRNHKRAIRPCSRKNILKTPKRFYRDKTLPSIVKFIKSRL